MTALFAVIEAVPHAQPRPDQRPALWVDALRGEPITPDDLIEDLRRARVIYLGEFHTIPRHHALETELLEGLAQRGARLALAMEPFELFTQPSLDSFNTGSSDLGALLKATDLPKRWPGHTNYLSLLTAAQKARIPLLALNARSETIRAIGRGGLAGLSSAQRNELPTELVMDDPIYERYLNQSLAVHMAFDPKKLRPVYEAQVARDETMASRLAEFLESPTGRDRTILVICGRGHCEFGLGTPARLERRMPKLIQRIVLFSESGDLQLSEEERRQARDIEISHQFLRELGRSAADYFNVAGPR